LEGSTIPTKNISGGLDAPYGLFVTNNGDVYVDNGATNGQVDKWTANATSSVIAMDVSGPCYSLFVDVNDNLYCSARDFHKVIKKLFSDAANISTTVAGNGTSGSASNMLNYPGGIFVDLNFQLYVADCYNDRVQLFQSGQLNGTTVAVNGTIVSQPALYSMQMDIYLL
jgi:hypothetical protein